MQPRAPLAAVPSPTTLVRRGLHEVGAPGTTLQRGAHEKSRARAPGEHSVTFGVGQQQRKSSEISWPTAEAQPPPCCSLACLRRSRRRQSRLASSCERRVLQFVDSGRACAPHVGTRPIKPLHRSQAGSPAPQAITVQPPGPKRPGPKCCPAPYMPHMRRNPNGGRKTSQQAWRCLPQHGGNVFCRGSLERSNGVCRLTCQVTIKDCNLRCRSNTPLPKT